MTAIDLAKHWARRAPTRLALLRLDAALRARGGRLIADVHPTARVVAPPRVVLLGWGDEPPVLRLSLGPNALLCANVSLSISGAESSLRLGPSARLHEGIWLRFDGGRTELGEGAWVGANSSLHVRGDFRMGEGAQLGLGTQIHAFGSVELGAHAATAHDVTIVDVDHAVDGGDTPWRGQPHAIEPITIGANALVSAGARILRGAHIGANSVVGANAVVRGGDYPDASLLVGIPAQVRRRLEPAARVGSR
jgi:acetyltransferase-like isoleucine patch superfamily enzyme